LEGNQPMSGSRRISELVTATALTGDEIFPLVQEGETRQAQVSVLRLLAPVQSVNNLTGNVLLALGDLTGVEPIVSAQGVSAAIAAVSLRVDEVSASITNNTVHINEVSAAVVSVQAYLISQLSIAVSGVFTEAPNDGQVYGRQSLTWVPVPVTAIQESLASVSQRVDAVSALAAAPGSVPYEMALACSDEQTAITTGLAIEFSFPRAFTLNDIVFECNLAPTSTTCAMQIRVSGSVLHSGYINIDPGQNTSRTAAVTTSLIKTNITAWRRAFVSVGASDATFAGLKVYILGTL
jgi:hypothetical protein